MGLALGQLGSLLRDDDVASSATTKSESLRRVNEATAQLSQLSAASAVVETDFLDASTANKALLTANRTLAKQLMQEFRAKAESSSC